MTKTVLKIQKCRDPAESQNDARLYVLEEKYLFHRISSIFMLFDLSLKIRPPPKSFSLPEGFNYVFQFNQAFLIGNIYLP